MVYLGPKVSTLFSCMWCKSGNHMWAQTLPYLTPSSVLPYVVPHLFLNSHLFGNIR